MKQGLLLINLGTPDSYSISAVWRYLSEFLADKRVIELPAIIRYTLLYAFILPFRVKRSAHAYQTIWTTEGSPLLCNSRNLVKKLQALLGSNYQISLGMRYGKPSIQQALSELQHCQAITVLPLYPQYSSAASGSSIEKVLQLVARQNQLPSIKVIRDFHSHPSYIAAQATLIAPFIADHDFLLLSYHGIPENHLSKGGCKKICEHNCLTQSQYNLNCYRAQCFKTSALIAETLQLNEQQYCTAFQSRLGRTSWIKPYTDKTLLELRKQGIKNLLVACPSFVADCLETLEEIEIRLKEKWLSLDGQKLTMVPSLNDNEMWLQAIQAITNFYNISN